MASVKNFQKLVKGNGQGQMFTIHGTIEGLVIRNTHSKNIKALSLRMKSYV